MTTKNPSFKLGVLNMTISFNSHPKNKRVAQKIELLNELKNETQQLKKTPIRFNTSTEDSKSDPQTKMDNIFSFPPENAESIVRYNPPSPASVDKPFSFGLTPERQM